MIITEQSARVLLMTFQNVSGSGGERCQSDNRRDIRKNVKHSFLIGQIEINWKEKIPEISDYRANKGFEDTHDF